jgi:hypothetical protein
MRSFMANGVVWALIGAGVLWTLGLLYFDRQIRRDPGRFGLIGKQANAAGPRSAALVCGLLTLLLVLIATRENFGWPEVATIVLACGALARWVIASIGLRRRRARRGGKTRRKPEKWRSLRPSFLRREDD